MLKEITNQGDDPMYFFVCEERLTVRLNELRYPIEKGFYFDTEDIEGMRETLCLRSFDIEYKTKRHKAWRNLMVATVNEALRRRIFSLRPGDNRWPGHDERTIRSRFEFDFVLPTGDAARATVDDIGFDELAIDAAVNLRKQMVFSGYYANLKECDAAGTTWLERQTGAWIQSAVDSFKCSRILEQKLLAMEVEPLGYGDKGRVRM
ncbi:hypothetical protein [Herbaspirillum sp.]|uniref:hypothetical protein n=1 Tax=Herbaspirillum sp. TaxID=1890675 RepID=UPI000C0B4076|nr:hypothetical protein [Herbaspirillum sp.]MAF02078.1 hypothetical protein [Herbaspirillum sp.]|tara:strand:+ start:133 stop:750 length:618 start_codon:yes stop_codon:yes gene_type:complete